MQGPRFEALLRTAVVAEGVATLADELAGAALEDIVSADELAGGTVGDADMVAEPGCGEGEIDVLSRFLPSEGRTTMARTSTATMAMAHFFKTLPSPGRHRVMPT